MWNIMNAWDIHNYLGKISRHVGTFHSGLYCYIIHTREQLFLLYES